MFHWVTIMYPQHLHIVAPQTAALGSGKGLRQCGYISAGKDIFADEGAGGAGLRHPADAVDEGVAVRLQQLADLDEILVEMSDANMLHHADRDYAVKLSGELPIVQLAKLDTVGNAGSLSMGACHLNLRGRNVDPSDVDARFARKMNGEATPARADLGHGHTGL